MWRIIEGIHQQERLNNTTMGNTKSLVSWEPNKLNLNSVHMTDYSEVKGNNGLKIHCGDTMKFTTSVS